MRADDIDLSKIDHAKLIKYKQIRIDVTLVAENGAEMKYRYEASVDNPEQFSMVRTAVGFDIDRVYLDWHREGDPYP